MQGTADDFKRHYESLSDETLLEEDREELVDVARQCLEEELARRGLTLPANAAEVPEPPSVDPGDEMVPAAIFSRADEADLARALLASADIPCFLANEHPGFSFSMANALGGLPLLVPARLLDQAREILDAPVSDEELTAEAEAAADAEERSHESAENEPQA